MVPVPQLPTDNLYKFAALLGLFLFALGVVGPMVLQHNLEEQYAARLAAANAIGREVQSRRALPGEKAAGDKIPAEAAELFTLGEIGNVETWLHQKEVAMIVHYRWLAWSRRGGVVLMASGLVLWFWRVQLRQDELASLEIERLKAELGKMHPSPDPMTEAKAPGGKKSGK